MIFYFTGTGNSRLGAKVIGQVTGDQVVDIVAFMKEGINSTFHSERPLVFVVPTYGWRIPTVVEKWIEANHFDGNNDAYFVLTCGDSWGNSEAYAKALCMKKGFNFMGLAGVIMPENYIALFKTTEPEEGDLLIQEGRLKFQCLAKDILEGRKWPTVKPSIKGRIQSAMVNPVFYKAIVKDKDFRVEPSCIGCGQCARLCPLNNIEMVDGKPVWKGKCTHCMACICACPKEAIEYGSQSKGRHRYYLPEDKC